MLCFNRNGFTTYLDIAMHWIRINNEDPDPVFFLIADPEPFRIRIQRAKSIWIIGGLWIMVCFDRKGFTAYLTTLPFTVSELAMKIRIQESQFKAWTRNIVTNFKIQGGSDISGTLSLLHRRIKKQSFVLIFFRKTISAVCRNIIINKLSHLSKDESTGRHRSRESLGTLRRIYHDRD